MGPHLPQANGSNGVKGDPWLDVSIHCNCKVNGPLASPGRRSRNIASNNDHSHGGLNFRRPPFVRVPILPQTLLR